MMDEDSLINYIVSNDLESLHRLLESTSASGCSRKLLNTVMHDGCTPLNLAISRHAFDVALMLIEYGSDVSLADSFRVDGCRKTPIHYACAAGNLDLVRLCVETYGIDPDEKDAAGSTPLHYASLVGHFEVVEYLVDTENYDINHQSNSGKTALWKAAMNGHKDIVHLLCSLGANVNARNRVGETVLFECCKKVRHLGIVEVLLQFGADVGIRDVEGNSVLHPTAVSGNTLAAELLIPSGARLDAVNEYGNTPLHNAAMHGQTAFGVALLNYGSPTDACNFSGQSILYVAMLHLQKNSCRLLRCAGVKLTSKDKDMFEKYEYRRSSKKQNFYQWLNELFNRPLKLTSGCRVVIRRHLTTNPITSILKLPLPKSIHQFLLLADMIACCNQDQGSAFQ